MPESSLGILIFIIVLAVGFGLVNGFNDAANAIAASVGSRSLSPRNALTIAATLNFVGAATGLAVAKTIGKGILIESAISYETVIAGLIAVVVWGSVATYLGLPVSITHSFVAALSAAGVAWVGTDAIQWGVLQRVLSSVAIAPVLGFFGGFSLMVAVFWIFRRNAPARMRVIFTRMQWLTTGFLAYSHGKNDGQMPIGVITMALVIFHNDTSLWDNVPWWVINVSALAISSGMAIGGWQVIRTMGMRITTLRPVDAFVGNASAAAVIEVASQLGVPVSTTHCASSAIMGIGATKGLSAVRWGVARNIVTAWVLTFPICGGLGYLFAWLFKGIFWP
ncbi:MAG: inorganic phosphate transporter [Dehalococcoidales bacterium]|nr:inorganic phosphate transporter [Dehalococcoidales bacterium]